MAAAKANKVRQQLALEEPSSDSDESINIEFELINRALEAMAKDSDNKKGAVRGAPKPKKQFMRPMDSAIRLSSQEVIELLPWLNKQD